MPPPLSTLPLQAAVSGRAVAALWPGHGGLTVLLGLGANWCGERRDATAGAALAAGACGRQVAALRRWDDAGTLLLGLETGGG